MPILRSSPFPDDLRSPTNDAPVSQRPVSLSLTPQSITVVQIALSYTSFRSPMIRNLAVQ